jgi:hypothetical protein
MIIRPVGSMSRAGVGDRSTVAPCCDRRALPSAATGTPNFARSEQMRRSHAIAIAHPPPAADHRLRDRGWQALEQIDDCSRRRS